MRHLCFLLFVTIFISISNIQGQISHSQTTNNGTNANALGRYCNADYIYSVGIGYNCDPSAGHAVAMGINCFANGAYSVALGDYNYANGIRSFACNHRNSASGESSFAAGFRNIAAADYSFVFGKYNLGLTNSILEVGWGTDLDERNNLLTLFNSGSLVLGSTSTVYGLIQLNTDIADEEHGITLYANAGSTARSYLRSDGGGNFNWFLTRGGVDVNGLVISASGTIGIGTTVVPYGYKLAVDGKIRAREVRVDLDSWSDNVFFEGYTLQSLQKVEEFIYTYHHLPDVPTETQVMEEGISLGEMNAVLLQKIEELTLYIIEQDKKLIQIEKELEVRHK